MSELAYTELVPEGDAERAIQYADDGFDLVVAHSFGYGETTKAVAADHPDTAFAWAGGIAGQEGNVADYEQPFHEAYYLLGIIAGDVSETGVLGGAGGFDIPACHSLIEAFYLGAQEINPEATESPTTSVTGSTSLGARRPPQPLPTRAPTSSPPAARGRCSGRSSSPRSAAWARIRRRHVVAGPGHGDRLDGVGHRRAAPADDRGRPGRHVPPAKYYSIGVAEDGLLVVINPELADRISPEAMELLETRTAEIKDGSFEVPFIPE